MKVLPVGAIPTAPTVLLKSEQFKSLINRLATVADLVIYDSSPLLAVSDPMLLASLVDGSVMVIAGGRSKIKDIRRAYSMLEQSRQPVYGAILNDAVYPSVSDYYYYDYASPAKRVIMKERLRTVFAKWARLRGIFRRNSPDAKLPIVLEAIQSGSQ
jgi:Mrp family chromosome partitioning ATPase